MTFAKLSHDTHGQKEKIIRENSPKKTCNISCLQFKANYMWEKIFI